MISAKEAQAKALAFEFNFVDIWSEYIERAIDIGRFSCRILYRDVIHSLNDRDCKRHLQHNLDELHKLGYTTKIIEGKEYCPMLETLVDTPHFIEVSW